MDVVQRFGRELWVILVESGLWLLLGFLMAGIMHAFVPKGFLRRQLGGKGFGTIAKASLLGLPLPLCSCSVIPVAAGLRRSGASKGAVAAFTVSTPQTGEESIPLTWALFGPVFALARPVIAVATALTTGVLVEKWGEGKASGNRESAGRKAGERSCCASGVLGEEPGPVEAAGSCCGGAKARPPRPAQERGCCCSGGPEEDFGPALSSLPVMGGVAQASGGSECCGEAVEMASCCSQRGKDTGGMAAPRGEEERGGIAARAGSMLRYALVTLPKDLAPWLILGLGGAALVGALVPHGWIEEHLPSGNGMGWGVWVQMLAMLVIGVPLYVCATSSTPLAYSLVLAGLSPGAALVLLLAGPATNTATIAWMLKDLGARALAIYLATISVFALACGWAFHLLFSGMVRVAEAGIGHEHHHGSGSAWDAALTAGAVGFCLLLAWAVWLRYGRRALAGQPAAV